MAGALVEGFETSLARVDRDEQTRSCIYILELLGLFFPTLRMLHYYSGMNQLLSSADC